MGYVYVWQQCEIVSRWIACFSDRRCFISVCIWCYKIYHLYISHVCHLLMLKIGPVWLLLLLHFKQLVTEYDGFAANTLHSHVTFIHLLWRLAVHLACGISSCIWWLVIDRCWAVTCKCSVINASSSHSAKFSHVVWLPLLYLYL